MNFIEALDDLHKQATTERSHYYVGKVVQDARAEITRLMAVADAAEALLSNYEQFDKEQSGLALALYDAGREVFGCYETCQCDPKPEDCDECAPREAVLKQMRALAAR